MIDKIPVKPEASEGLLLPNTDVTGAGSIHGKTCESGRAYRDFAR